MSHQLSQLQQLFADNDIKFIRLAFCDIAGVQKNVAIMADQLERAVTEGISFDASAVAGFGSVVKSDLFLVPDLDTFSILPWRPSESGVCRFFCNIRHPDGRPFEGDGRYLLRQMEKQAQQEGYSFLTGPECEFYLFETGEEGRPTLRPMDQGGYFDMYPMDRGENVRRQICLRLEEMGIRPERSHHEHGPGQNEVDFRCASPLSAADNLMALRTAVKAIAGANGLFASFLPSPLEGECGNGLHLNLSLFHGGRNLFADFAQAPDPRAAAFLAGVLRRAPELTAFTNSLPGSYRRLGRHEAPGTVSWSCQNRSTLVRIPCAKERDARMEVRSPDPACNPYLTIALLLHAGFEGVREKLLPPPCADFDLYAEEGMGIPSLPASLDEALDAAQSSDFLRRTLPQWLLERYLSLKREEAAAWRAAEDKTAYELTRYFPQV